MALVTPTVIALADVVKGVALVSVKFVLLKTAPSVGAVAGLSELPAPPASSV